MMSKYHCWGSSASGNLLLGRIVIQSALLFLNPSVLQKECLSPVKNPLLFSNIHPEVKKCYLDRQTFKRPRLRAGSIKYKTLVYTHRQLHLPFPNSQGCYPRIDKLLPNYAELQLLPAFHKELSSLIVCRWLSNGKFLNMPACYRHVRLPELGNGQPAAA